MEENTIKVYVRIGINNVITQIESNISDINFSTGWTQIDEGVGDKYSHAQNNYLEKKLRDINGKFNYKLVDNKVLELAEEEKATLFSTPTPSLTLEERISMLENLQLQQEGVI